MSPYWKVCNANRKRADGRGRLKDEVRGSTRVYRIWNGLRKQLGGTTSSPMRSLLCWLLICFGVVAPRVQAYATIIICSKPTSVRQIAFEKSTVREAVAKLCAAVSKEGEQLNVIVDLPSEYGPRVTFQAEMWSVSKILEEIARQGGCELYVETFAVVIRKKGAGPIPPIRGEPDVVRFWQKWLAPVLFPRVDFRDASLREAIDFIVQKSKQLGPERGMNLVAKRDGVRVAGAGVQASHGRGIPGLDSALPSDQPAVTEQPQQLSGISMDVRNMPILELLRYTAGVAGCEVTAEKKGLFLTPAAKRKSEAKSQGGGRKGPAQSSKRKANR